MAFTQSDSAFITRIQPSPNFNARQCPISMIVLHYTGMQSDKEAEARLACPQAEVSAHYLIYRCGEIVQMVEENNRAWHAGVSFFAGETDINSTSIGIELCNPGHEFGYQAFTAPQIHATIQLCQDIQQRHAIQSRFILAHSDVAPERKQDPGELFPWQELAKADIGLWVPPSPIISGRYFMQGDHGEPIKALQMMLAFYGYQSQASGYYDQKTTENIMAFQRHFRPEKIDGIADKSTIDTLHNLCRIIK